MAQTTPTISEFMTEAPHSIGMNQSLEEAHRLMRENRIRHLPVLDGGKLVGIVSERDLHLLETFRDVDAAKVTIEEAMTSDPYVVGPRASLLKVALEMWKNKYGSAVVMQGQKLVGVFTTVDALGALATLIARGGKAAPARPPARKAARPSKARAAVPKRKPAAKKRRTR